MPQYKTLNQKHHEYDHDKLERLESLYEGGDELLENLSLFIPQKPGEHPTVYAERLSHASYINYMAEIIDYYASNLFSKPLAVMAADDASDPSTLGQSMDDNDFYQQFAADANLAGDSLSAVLKMVFTDTLTYGYGYVGVDFPLITEMPTNLQEEEEMGASRAYLYCVDVESVINWEMDDFGKFKWIVLKKCYCPQQGPLEEVTKKIHQFKIWTIENGYAKWAIYEIETKLNREPKPNDEVALVSEGITSFHEIPVLCLEVEKGLWIGNKIGNLCADHLKLRTSLLHGEARSLYAMPWYKQGAEFDGSGALSHINEDVHRGNKGARAFSNKGFAVLGPSDEVGFMEPEGKAYELINQQLADLADEIHRVVHQMANTIKAQTQALSRSAASKDLDNRATEIILQEYGSTVREFAKQVYVCISEARNEDIVWTAKGLSNYQVVDKEMVLKEAMALNGAIDIPSDTFKKLHLNLLVSAFVPNISPDTQMVIQKEIEDAIDSGHFEQKEEDELNRQLALVEAKRPPRKKA